MRAQAIEQLMKLMIEAIEKDPLSDSYMQNLAAKGRILIDRSDDKSASVVRELINS